MKYKRCSLLLALLCLLFMACSDESSMPKIRIDEYTQSLEYKLGDNGEYYVVTGTSDMYLEELFIPDTYNGLPVKEIKYEAFKGMTTLDTVVLPDSIEKVGFAVFADCDNLETVVLSENLSVIANEMFRNCENLKKIAIPSSVCEIGDMAFEQAGLEEIKLVEGLTTIGWSAFSDTDIEELEIPASVTRIAAGVCKPFMGNPCKINKLTVAKENKSYYSKGNCIISSDGKLILGANDSKIPEGVTEIVADAFRGCELGNVKIPSSVLRIGEDAFNEAKIKTLSLSEGLMEIDSNAFEDAEGFNSIVIPQSVQVIHFAAFEGCDTLEKVEIKGTTELYSYAFARCTNLQEVIFSSLMDKIDEDAFLECADVEFEYK